MLDLLRAGQALKHHTTHKGSCAKLADALVPTCLSRFLCLSQLFILRVDRWLLPLRSHPVPVQSCNTFCWESVQSSKEQDQKSSPLEKSVPSCPGRASYRWPSPTPTWKPQAHGLDSERPTFVWTTHSTHRQVSHLAVFVSFVGTKNILDSLKRPRKRRGNRKSPPQVWSHHQDV